MKKIALILTTCFLFSFSARNVFASTITYNLDIVTNPAGASYVYSRAAIQSVLTNEGARWGVVGLTATTNVSGQAIEAWSLFSEVAIDITRQTNYYTPVRPEFVFNGPISSTNKTYYFIPYSNTLSISFSGLSSPVNWTLSAPSEFTNSSAYCIGGGGSLDLVAVPTGTYSVTLPTVRGYATPKITSTNITGESPLINTLALDYLAYTNSLSVTIIGYPAGNAAWSINGPADWTNAAGYAPGFTNNAIISGVPTGTYAFNFPGSIGYITPTNTIEITGAMLANCVTGIYVLAYPTNIPSGAGIQKFYQPSYFFTNVYLHDSGVPLHTRLASVLFAESDPVFTNWLATTALVTSNTGNWAGAWQGHSTNDFAPAGAATGTPVYVESDPVFSASVAYGITAADTSRWNTAATDASNSTNSIAVIQASTSLWNTAASDATSATGTIAVIQLSTGAWTKAASDADTATNAIPRITELEGRTNAWNAGATDASTATNETAVLRGATNALDTRLTAHATNVAPHVSIADRTNWNGKATLADVAGVGYFTSLDLSGWSTNRATGPVFWSSTRNGIDITSTGALSPNVSGRYLYSHVTNNFDHSAWREVFVCTNGYMLHPGNFIGSDTYRICSTASELPYIFISSATNPATVYTEVAEVSTGAPSGTVAVAASTNIVSIGQDTGAPDSMVITGNVKVASIQLGTNTPATDWPVTDLSSLNAATNAINARVTDLETPYQPWVTVIPDAGATATVTYAAGPLVQIIATNSPTTITFDNSAYPTSGVCSVNLEIYAFTNSIAFVSDYITNSTAPTISTSDWTSVFYRKVGTNILWKGRN